MKRLILLICFSLAFSQELKVEGNLNVTGNIQNQTIDSLLQVIQDLQSQIGLLRVDNKLETKIYETDWLSEGDKINIFTDLNISISELDF